ncbi:hypothetical protein, partial [Streptomyces zhihengii]
IEPGACWTETPDGEQLDAVFRDWPAGIVAEEHWPHGVYLGWDQRNGWLLIEDGGSRNTWPLSENSGTYSRPRQIAADTHARLTHGMDGYTPGPICATGPLWDDRIAAAAVAAWEQAG